MLCIVVFGLVESVGDVEKSGMCMRDGGFGFCALAVFGFVILYFGCRFLNVCSVF